MLHIKFQDYWLIDSGVLDFQRFLPYMARSSDLDNLSIFSFPSPMSLYMKFGYNWPSGF